MAGRTRKGTTEGIPPSKFYESTESSSSKKEADSLGEVCRICASGEGVFTNIFKLYQRDSPLARNIFTCLQIKIARFDDLPKSLCHKCLFTLKQLKKFLKIALKKSVCDLKRCVICHSKPDKNLTFRSPIVADKLQYCSVLKINVNVADGRKICKKCFFELECLFDMTKIALKSQDYFLSIKNQSSKSIPIPPNSKSMTVKQFRENNPVIIEKSVLKESKMLNKNVSVIVHDVMIQYNLTENDQFSLKDNEVVKSYEGFETNKKSETQSSKFNKLRALSKSLNIDMVNTDANKIKRRHLNRSVATVRNKKVFNSGKSFDSDVKSALSAVDRPRSAHVHIETIGEHNKSVLKYSPRKRNIIDDQKLSSVSVTRDEVRNIPEIHLYKKRMSSFQQKVNKNIITTDRPVKKTKKMLKRLKALNLRRNADLVSNISDSSDTSENNSFRSDSDVSNKPLKSPPKQTNSKQSSSVQQMVNDNDICINATKTKKLNLNKSFARVKNKKVFNSGNPFDSEIEAKSSAVERPKRAAHVHNGTIDEHNKSVLKYSPRKLNIIDDQKLSSVPVTRDEVRNIPETHLYKKRMSSFQQKVNKDVITDRSVKKRKNMLKRLKELNLRRNADLVSSDTSHKNLFGSDSDVSYKLPYRHKSSTAKPIVNDNDICIDAIKTKKLNLNTSIATVKNKKVLNLGNHFDSEIEAKSSAVERLRRSKRKSSFQQNVNKDIITDEPMKKRKKMLNPGLVFNISDSSDTSDNNSFGSESDVSNKLPYRKKSTTAKKMVNDNHICTDAIKTKKLNLNMSVVTVKNKKVFNSGNPFASEIETELSAEDLPRRSSHAHNETTNEHNKSVFKYSLRKLNRIDVKKPSSVSVTRDEVRNIPETHLHKKRMSSFQQKVNKDVKTTDQPVKKRKKLLKRLDKGKSNQPVKPTKAPKSEHMSNKKEITNCKMLQKKESKSYSKNLGNNNNKLYTTDSSKSNGKVLKLTQNRIYKRIISKRLQNVNDKDETKTNKQVKTCMIRNSERLIKNKVPDFERQNARIKVRNKKFDSVDISNKSSDCLDNNSSLIDLKKSGKKSRIAAKRRTYKKIHSKTRVILKRQKIPQTKLLFKKNKKSVNVASTLMTSSGCSDNSYLKASNKKIFTTDSNKRNTDLCTNKDRATKKTNVSLHVKLNAMSKNRSIKKKKEILKHEKKQKTKSPKVVCVQVEKTAHPVGIPSTSSGYSDNNSSITDQPVEDGLSSKIPAYKENEKIEIVGPVILSELACSTINTPSENNDLPDLTSEKVSIGIADNLTDDNPCREHELSKSSELQNEVCKSLERDEYMKQIQLNVVVSKQHITNISTQERKEPDTHDDNIESSELAPTITDTSVVMSVDTHSDALHVDNIESSELVLTVTDKSVDMSIDTHTNALHDDNIESSELAQTVTDKSVDMSVDTHSDALHDDNIEASELAPTITYKSVDMSVYTHSDALHDDNVESSELAPTVTDKSVDVPVDTQSDALHGDTIELQELAPEITDKSVDISGDAHSDALHDDNTESSELAPTIADKSVDMSVDTHSDALHDDNIESSELAPTVTDKSVDMSVDTHSDALHDDNIEASELAPTITYKSVDMSVYTHSDALHDDNVESSELAPTVTDKSVDVPVDTQSDALHGDTIELQELAPEITDKSVDISGDAHSDALHDDNTESSELAPTIADKSVDMSVDTHSDALHDDNIESSELAPTVTDKSVDMSVYTHSDALHDDNVESSELAPTVTDKSVDVPVDTQSDALHGDTIELPELAPEITDKSVDISVDAHSDALHDDNTESSELAPTIADKSVDMSVDIHSDALHDDNIESSELAPTVTDKSVDMPVDTQSDALHGDTIELPQLAPEITDKLVDISVDAHSGALHDDNTESSELAPTIADKSVDMSVDNHSDASPNDLPIRDEHFLINELSNNVHRSPETKEFPTEIKPLTKSKVIKKKKQVLKVKSNSEKHISSTYNNDVVELMVPYTCQICNEIFDSTVQGMLHWLTHEHENSPRVLIKSSNKSSGDLNQSSPESTYDSHKKKQEKSDEQSAPTDRSDSDIDHDSESHLILFLSDSDDELVEETVQSTPSICSINDTEYPIINKEEEVPNPQCIIDALTGSEKIAQPKLLKDSLEDLTVNHLTVSKLSTLESNTTKDYETTDVDLNRKLTENPEEGAETLSMIAEAVVERNISIVENRAEIENVGMSDSSLLKHLEE